MLPQASECPVGFGRPATGRGGRLRVGSPLRRRQGSGPAGTEPRAGGMDAEPSAPPGTDCGAAWSAHLTGGQGVAGSNPANPTGRMASNSIRCIVDTFRRRDGGTLPTKAGRRVWNPGWYGSGGSRRSTADSDDGSRGLGEDSPPLVGGEESPSCSFLLCLDVSSDGFLADVSDTAEVGAG